MPDITMCMGTGCKKKDTCYRCIAEADKYQSYFTNVPVDKEGNCKYYWPTEQKKRSISA